MNSKKESIFSRLVRFTRAKKRFILGVLGGLLLLTIVAFSIPKVRESILFQLDQFRLFIRYTLYPPETYVFVPEGNQGATLTPQKPTTSPSPIPTSLITPTPTPQPSPTPTLPPLPEKVLLQGVRYQDQHGLWNYCAPTNLAMALSYWGLDLDRKVVGAVLKPEQDDKNVMPYEMVSYVSEQTNLMTVSRMGGTQELLKRFLAAGFPVLIEKGVLSRETLTGKIVWMGHYNVVVGYDEAKSIFIVRDSYYSPPEYPLDYPISYIELAVQWRVFNNIFIVIYSPDREADVTGVLGDYMDEAISTQKALDTALQEADSLTGVEQFFAWFNVGTSYNKQFEYGKAAQAYDEAFRLYANLPKEQRPFRMMWYQTGPYFAYFYTSRYQDVVDLATTTLDSVDKPYLEESWYWRGMAKINLGDVNGGIEDLQASLKYHPGFAPALEALKNLGVPVS
jgi:hypothetical protein